ncbi:MAG: hypothetical protein Q8Q02_00280 [Nocardioides sp.]|nr:hypothetical protein [Nocardioides sp.]
MSALEMVTVVAVIVTGMTLPAGVWRLAAYRSGQVDHTPGMRGVAFLALGMGIAGAVTLAVCVVLLALQA